MRCRTDKDPLAEPFGPTPVFSAWKSDCSTRRIWLTSGLCCAAVVQSSQRGPGR